MHISHALAQNEAQPSFLTLPCLRNWTPWHLFITQRLQLIADECHLSFLKEKKIFIHTHTVMRLYYVSAMTVKTSNLTI